MRSRYFDVVQLWQRIRFGLRWRTAMPAIWGLVLIGWGLLLLIWPELLAALVAVASVSGGAFLLTLAWYDWAAQRRYQQSVEEWFSQPPLLRFRASRLYKRRWTP